MAKIAGEQVFLLLKRSADLRGHEVKIVPTFEKALAEWDSTTRSSPIFPLENAKLPPVHDGRPWFLAFVGPIDPGTLDLDGTNCFVSYGIHNLIAVTDIPGDEAFSRILLAANNANVPWEGWRIEGTTITHVEYSLAHVEEPPVGVAVDKPSVAAQLKSASEEYRTLIAVTRAKCARYLPAMAPDIEAFDEAFQLVLERTENHQVEKLAWLANVNAALSRLSSQTFAGTSPILETECHFWTHSLLGIGTATQALVNIRRHHDKAIANSRLAEKINGLASVSDHDVELVSASFTDPRWQAHWLEKVRLGKHNGEQTYSKLIAYFSGRDGYRSTSFTLSAPLELITGCNTYAWTPLTLTHELSHTLTSLVLSPLLDGIETDDGSARLVKLVTPSYNYTPRTALDQAQKALVNAYMLLELEGLPDEYHDSGASLTASALRTIVASHHEELVELVTHILDFQYFYGRNVDLYMTSIWESWDVIPNIQSRIEEYITRTLVAVLSNHQRGDDFINVTYDVVLGQLQRLSDTAAGGQYISLAYQRLRDNKEYFCARLLTRVAVVKLVLAFFYDPGTQVEIARDVATAGGRYSTLRVDQLDDWQIRNPLSFLVQYATDRVPNGRKALWMLHKLAFLETS
ncbi:MAG TPA: hypothetical protein VJU59_11165 [Paraburkholderia sp.]|uniref:hypothetical protein n=1 Tax=Paraburkholderia sp. TaxID=1926495 RepID=UPI002B47A5FB|nr:hypothetical protein [Paraburkholderia sp.]HKR40219.1 hypothetical protein [Paraburkholderia sp.]